MIGNKSDAHDSKEPSHFTSQLNKNDISIDLHNSVPRQNWNKTEIVTISNYEDLDPTSRILVQGQLCTFTHLKYMLWIVLKIYSKQKYFMTFNLLKNTAHSLPVGTFMGLVWFWHSLSKRKYAPETKWHMQRGALMIHYDSCWGQHHKILGYNVCKRS